MKKSKEIVFFTRYAENGASSRLRFLQYLPFLKAKGVTVEVKNFFSRQYLIAKYNKKKYGLIKTIKLYLQQFKYLQKCCNDLNKIWVIEYELFPFIPYFLEKKFLKNRQYILNFDDNVWEKYCKLPFRLFLGSKYDKLIKNAKAVIVANQFLYEKVRKYNDNLILIPTAIDVARYQRHKLGKFSQFTVGWIGTPETYHYVTEFAEYWQKLAEALDFKLLIIAKENLRNQSITGVNMEFIDWSERIETSLLQQCHIGIMPLTEDNFSQGKSAYKIVQYLASGVVPIASNVGENNNVIRHGENGFLVENSIEEWIKIIRKLATDEEYLMQIRENALCAAEKYDIKLYSERIIDLID